MLAQIFFTYQEMQSLGFGLSDQDTINGLKTTPKFTSSVEDAKLLVPFSCELFGPNLDQKITKPRIWNARIIRENPRKCISFFGYTPAFAVVLTCLKFLAFMEGE